MKLLSAVFFGWLAWLPISCEANDIANLKSWLMSQPVKLGTALDMRGQAVGVSYLALASAGQYGWGVGGAGSGSLGAGKKAVEYASINAGIDFTDKRVKALVIPMARPQNIAAWLWNKVPENVQSRTRYIKLPDMELGIGIGLPVPNESWIIGAEVRAVAAFRL